MLGGLITDEKRRDAVGFPILSRLPVVGALFRNTIKSKTRTELIILMRPEVSLTELDLYRLRQKTEQKTHFGPELDQDCADCPPRDEGKAMCRRRMTSKCICSCRRRIYRPMVRELMILTLCLRLVWWRNMRRLFGRGTIFFPAFQCR